MLLGQALSRLMTGDPGWGGALEHYGLPREDGLLLVPCGQDSAGSRCHKMDQPVGYGQYVPAYPLAQPTLLTPGAVLALAHVYRIRFDNQV